MDIITGFLLWELLVEQVFFAACINELVLDMGFRNPFPILAVAS